MNMFAYCGNEPVNYCDPTGERPEMLYVLEEATKSFVSETRNLLVKEKERVANKNGTLSVGVTLSAGCGGGFSLSLGVALDNKGNIGLYTGYSAGASSPSAFAGAFATMTNASSIYALGGEYGSAIDTGMGIGEVFGVGADFLVINDRQKPTGQSYGLTVQGGIAANVPVPFEFHTHVSGGYVSGFNFFDGIIAVCDLIIWG